MPLNAHLDPASLVRVLGRVVEQIHEHLRKPCGVGLKQQFILRQRHIEPVLKFIDQRAGRVDGILQHIDQLHTGPAQFNLSLVDAAHIHQVIDESAHCLDLAFDQSGRPLHLGRRVALAPEHFDRVAYRGERVAQFVGKRGKEFVFSAAGIAQLCVSGLQCVRAFPHSAVQRFVQLRKASLGAAALADLGQHRAIGHLERTALAEQLCKHRHLGTQHGCIHRLVQVIDRAAAVAFEDVLIFVVIGREKNDGDACRLLALLDQLGEFEAGHPGHAHIQHQHRELMRHQGEQCLFPRTGAHQPVAGVVKHRFQHHQVLRLIIDDQDVDQIAQGECQLVLRDDGRGHRAGFIFQEEGS